jgi:hypothetical protein
MHSTARNGREAKIIALDRETLEMKRSPIHQLQTLRWDVPQTPAIQIYAAEIREIIRRRADDPKRSIGIKLLTPRLRGRRDPQRQQYGRERY